MVVLLVDSFSTTAPNLRVFFAHASDVIICFLSFTNFYEQRAQYLYYFVNTFSARVYKNQTVRVSLKTIVFFILVFHNKWPVFETTHLCVSRNLYIGWYYTLWRLNRFRQNGFSSNTAVNMFISKANPVVAYWKQNFVQNNDVQNHGNTAGRDGLFTILSGNIKTSVVCVLILHPLALDGVISRVQKGALRTLWNLRGQLYYKWGHPRFSDLKSAISVRR